MSPVAKRPEEGGAGRKAPRLLPVAGLDLGLVSRVRAGVSAEAVEDYRADLDRLPPLRVALVGGTHVVVGGLHRLRAQERAGRAEVPCLVEPMTWAEAVRAAVSDNRAHGLRMGRADKRAAVRLLLAEAPDMSDRAMAELVGCSPTTVGEVRAQVSKLDTSTAVGEVRAQVSSLDASPKPEPAPRVSRPDTSPELGPKPGVSGPGTLPPPVSAASDAPVRAAPRKGRDGKLYHPKAGPRPGPAVTGERRRPTALPAMGAALLVDLRTKAGWVAGYLRCVLRTRGGGYRAEALDEVLGGLDAAELRELARRAEQAAEGRGGGQAATTAGAATVQAH